MAESDRRNPLRSAANPSPSEPIQINGATALPVRKQESLTADGKYRLAETLIGTASVSFSRERVFAENGQLAKQFGSLIVVTTSHRDDDIRIKEQRDGTLDVEVNGKQFQVTLGGRQQLAIRSGDGNDAIFASRVESGLMVESGDGDDIVITGSGSDHISGNQGNDTILPGSGDNDVNGGDGDDTIGIGGDGDDIAYAGKGNDVIMRGTGRGIKYVDSGAGNDRVSGGLDKTIISLGAGKNQVVRSHKDDHVFASDPLDSRLGSSIKIDGTPEFRERVAADLTTLRSSPAGRQMLAALDLAARTKGNSVAIHELTHENNGHAHGYGDLYLKGSKEGVVAGTGGDATIGYNPTFRGGSLPIVVLHHELAHAYNIVTGTFQPGFYFGPGIDGAAQVNNRELQAVGLPNGGFKFFGGDGRASGTSNPEALTENGLRKEIGIPLRGSYTLPPASLGSTASALPASSVQSAAKYLNSMAEAVITNASEALQKAAADLLASESGQRFIKEGAAELARQAVTLTAKNSTNIDEPAQPLKSPQNVRSR